MTEEEYIDATNLDKLRIVADILRDCLFLDKDKACRHLKIIEEAEAMMDELFIICKRNEE